MKSRPSMTSSPGWNSSMRKRRNESGKNYYYYYLLISNFIITMDSFIQAISIAPLQVHYYSEALPSQHGYCAGISRRSATGNCEQRTCPRFLRGDSSASRTHDHSDKRRRLYQSATTPYYRLLVYYYCCCRCCYYYYYYLFIRSRYNPSGYEKFSGDRI